MENSLSIKIKNKLQEIDLVRTKMGSFFTYHKVPDDVIYGVELAVEEVVTNIISYGYQDEEVHEIFIDLSIENNLLILTFTDDGIAFDPLSLKEPDLSSSIHDRPIGGLGIFLSRKFMDEMTYSYLANKNCLSMKKKIK